MDMLRYFVVLISISALISCKSGTGDEKINDKANIGSGSNAIEQLNQKIAAAPSNHELLYERAELFLASRQIELAENDIVRAIRLDSTVAKYHIGMSDVEFAKNRAFAAKAELDRALSYEPENVDALLRMAEIHLIVKKHQQSIDYINRALVVDKYSAKAYFMKGMNYKEIKDTAKAVSSFQTCVEQDANYYDAYMQLGIIMEAKKDPLAVEYFDAAVNIKPKSTEALYGKAMYYQNQNDFDNAIITYTEILKNNSCHLDAHFNLGYIHYVHLKVYRQAIKHYDDAIACNKSFLKAYYNRGLAYEALGDVGNAKSSYAEALAIDPNYVYAQEAMMRINQKL